MAGLTDRLTRRLLPRAVVTLSQVTWPARAAASLRRRLGRRGCVEVFFAFDDPSSAVAVAELSAATAGREVRLALRPVVRRGIDGDPALDDKRGYAIDDARRRGARAGVTVARAEPVPAGETAFLAAGVASGPPGPALERFTVEALRQVWSVGGGRVDPNDFTGLWDEQVGGFPPENGDAAVYANEHLMRRRGPYDTPAAWVHGQWFFAHDRVAQIGTRLDDLGWTAR